MVPPYVGAEGRGRCRSPVWIAIVHPSIVNNLVNEALLSQVDAAIGAGPAVDANSEKRFEISFFLVEDESLISQASNEIFNVLVIDSSNSAIIYVDGYHDIDLEEEALIVR